MTKKELAEYINWKVMINFDRTFLNEYNDSWISEDYYYVGTLQFTVFKKPNGKEEVRFVLEKNKYLKECAFKPSWVLDIKKIELDY